MENKYLYIRNDYYELYNGKMQDVLDTLEQNSIDSIVCDPPYHLTSIQERFGKENSKEAQYGRDGSFQRLSKGFMGQTWDGGDTAFQPDTWKHCFRVLKDGGYLLAFGGSRTFHRIACAIEDAGFEIRDTIMWLYGSGFPKSMNIGLAIDKKNGVESEVIGKGKSGKKETHTNSLNFVNGSFGGEYEIKKCANEWQGWGTCLKPAYEPIIVARKPFKGSLIDNVIENGVGGLNIDECRIPTSDDLARINKTDNGMFGVGNNNKAQQCKEQGIEYGGRFPANVITDGSEEVAQGMPFTNGGSQIITNKEVNRKGLTSENPVFNPTNCGFKTNIKNDSISSYGDNGSAMRYFYCAKASKKDRDEGLDLFEIKTKVFNGKSTTSSKNIKDVEKRFTTKLKNIHPTVKPVDLMQYLVRLVTPKNGTILDCFMGSGSTGKAVMFENRERNANYHFIGIEMTDEYLPICHARIDYALNKYDYDLEKEKQEDEKRGKLSIFDYLEE